ncbi:MAG: hypothetical protein EXQ87_06965 [Alphaproteobacteria bacterium]|nr:hypothetical protein [Alphaproteobacteria bacterium]
MPMQWIEVNGVSLRYESTGKGPKTPLVLIHELGGSLESWDPTLAAFAAAKRVLRFDLRGAGISERVRGTLPLDVMLADIADTIPGARYLNIASGYFMAVQTPELFLSHALPFLDAA